MQVPRTTISTFPYQKAIFSRDQIEELQRLAQQTKQPLDRLLIELNLVGDGEVQMERAQELGMLYLDLDRTRIDDSVRSLVPREILVQHRVVPVKRDGINLWLASSDPANHSAFDAVRSITGLRVIPVLALAQKIEDVLAQWTESV